MKTPTTSIVTSTVASAAKLGAALRRMARTASRRKKPNLTSRPLASASALLATRPHQLGELTRALIGGIGPGGLVAHDATPGELEHTPAHLVDHRLVVGHDQHRGARAIDAVKQPHDVDAGVGVEVSGRLVGQ